MPVYQLGYRPYEGRLSHPALRWWTIARSGIAIAWRSRLLRRLQYSAWIPLFYFIPLFFGVGLLLDPAASVRNPLVQMVHEFFGRPFIQAIQQEPERYRTTVWLLIFGLFAGLIQPIATAVVITMTAPPLISNDVRTRAFLVYFSKPISRWEYLLGKLATVLFFAFTTTLFPSLALYALSIAFSPRFGTLIDTWTVVPRVTLGCLALTVPASLVALWVSSLTHQARFAAVGWILACVFGLIAYRILDNTPNLGSQEWPFLLSLYDSVHTLQLGILGVAGLAEPLRDFQQIDWLVKACSPSHSPWLALGFLSVLSAACVVGILRRISAPMKI